MEKAGVRGQKLLKMRKPAHAKKVCGRDMTILLVSAYQTVLKKARSGPTTGAPAYGELTHISTRRAAETGIRIGVAHQPVCAFRKSHTRRFRRKHLRSLDASSPRSFTCPLLHGLTLETALTRSLPNLRRLLRRLSIRPVAQTDGSFGQASLQGPETSGNVLNRSLRCFLRTPLLIRRQAHTDS